MADSVTLPTRAPVPTAGRGEDVRKVPCISFISGYLKSVQHESFYKTEIGYVTVLSINWPNRFAESL